MTLRSLLTQDVELLTRSDGAVDDYGSPVPGWTSRGTVRGFVQPVAADEVMAGADTQRASFRAFLPADADVSGLDRVVVDGVTYEVLGPPLPHRTPRGVHHLEVTLEVVG